MRIGGGGCGSDNRLVPEEWQHGPLDPGWRLGRRRTGDEERCHWSRCRRGSALEKNDGVLLLPEGGWGGFVPKRPLNFLPSSDIFAGSLW